MHRSRLDSEVDLASIRSSSPANVLSSGTVHRTESLRAGGNSQLSQAVADGGSSVASGMLNQFVIVIAACSLGIIFAGAAIGYVIYKAGLATPVLMASGIPGAEMVSSALPATATPEASAEETPSGLSGAAASISKTGSSFVNRFRKQPAK